MQVKFYLGQNEDCSQGDSTSDSSEKLLQRGGDGGGQNISDLGERKIHTIKHIFFQKVSASLVKLSASHEEQSSPWRILVLFWIGDTRIELILINWLLKIFNCLEDLFCQFFFEHRVPHFCCPPWSSFRGCWKSAATAARALILVEVDGKHLWQVSIFSWHSAWGSFTQPGIVLYSEAARLSTALVVGWSLPWLCPSPWSQANPIPQVPIPGQSHPSGSLTWDLSPALTCHWWGKVGKHTHACTHTHTQYVYRSSIPPNTQPLVNQWTSSCLDYYWCKKQARIKQTNCF